MCTYRSYFEKNNTLVYNSEINTAKNQVTELVYGYQPNIHSRFIFKIDLNNLINKINIENISIDRATSHKLKIFNTINQFDKFIGSEIGYGLNRKRASSFELILFEVDDEWDEGSGYDMSFNLNNLSSLKNVSASNWFYKKTNQQWDFGGVYDDTTQLNILGTIGFDNGDENIDFDITDYINDIIYNNRPNNGLGIAFRYDLEQSVDDTLYSVAFHTKYTFTIFEPIVETTLNLVIEDDRNTFLLNNENRLYLYAKRGQEFFNLDLEEVRIYNHKYELVDIIDNTEINEQSKGIYYIDLNLSSDEHIDSVIYYDRWIYNITGTTKTLENEFFLIENETNMMIESSLPKNNISLTISGVKQDQLIKRGEKIILDFILKKLYKQHNSFPLDFEYRIYIPQSGRTELNVIPFTKVNRAPNKNFIILDTSILIPHKYELEVKLNNVDYVLNYENIKFIIVD